jgi:hypothetical protein
MRFVHRTFLLPSVTALVLFAAGTAAAQTEPVIAEVRYGPEVELGEGTARTYLAVDAEGRPVEFGVALSETALATLPDMAEVPIEEAFLAIDLPLPEGAPAPYKLVGFDWNPRGHPPVEIYGHPHFDVHFYTIDVTERDLILPADSLFEARGSKAPEPGYLPAAYVYAPESTVPKMGGHWIDPSSHEFHGEAFDKTFIYGTWEGKVIFIEPMMTKAFIETKADGTYEIATPEKVAVAGWYPAAYRVRFDPEAKEYRIALTNLTERK